MPEEILGADDARQVGQERRGKRGGRGHGGASGFGDLAPAGIVPE